MWLRDLDDWFKRLLEDVYERAPLFDLIGNSPFEIFLGRVAAERRLEVQTLRRISFLYANNMGLSDCGFTEQEAKRIHVASLTDFNKVIYPDPRRLAPQFRLREVHVARALEAFRGSRYDVAPLTFQVGGGQCSIQATVQEGGLLYRTSVHSSLGTLPRLQALLHVTTMAGEQLGDTMVPNAFLDLGRGVVVSEEELIACARPT